MRISVYPICREKEIAAGKMSLFDWIEMSRQLDAEGLEPCEGFLASFERGHLEDVAEAIHGAGFQMPTLCCSPDFTNPDPNGREEAIAHEAKLIEVTAALEGCCRVLSGQRYPDVSWLWARRTMPASSSRSFHGQLESGLAKMAVLGLGKQRGASAMHAWGTGGFQQFLAPAARLFERNTNLIGGLAVLENANEETADIVS